MQFEFQNISLLWALLAILPFAFFMWQKKNRQPASFSWRRLLLINFAFAACIVGLSRPQMGMRVTESQSLRSNLFFAIDVSKSMLAQDIGPSRLGFSVAFAQRLLDQLSGVKVAIYPFALEGYVQMPLTTDLFAAADMMSALSPSVTTAQGTDISASLEGLLVNIAKMQSATDRSGGEWLPTQVVLFSDGESHYPIREDISREFKRRKMPVFTVGVGTTSGAIIPLEGRYPGEKEFQRDGSGKPVRSALNVDTLRKIADQTGGEYFQSRFEEVYRLAKSLTQSMHLGKLTTTFRSDREFFPFCFAAALFLFLIEFGFGRWQYAIRSWLPWFLLLTLSGTGLQAAPPDEQPTADPEVRSIRAYNEGLTFLKQGNTNRAAEMFQESALLTQNKEIRKKALFNLGNTYLRASDPALALESYQQTLEVTAEDKKFSADTNQKTYDNIALAQKLQEQMKGQPKEGEGDGKEGSDSGDKTGKNSADPKGPQKDYQQQNFNANQKQKIFDLISAEEQQIMQRLQDEKNRKHSSRFNDKPW